MGKRSHGSHKIDLTSAIVAFDGGRVDFNEQREVFGSILILLELEEGVPSQQQGFGIVRIDLSEEDKESE